MFIVLPFVLVVPLLGKINGGNFIYKVCNVWARVWYFFTGIRHQEIYEAPHNRNHQYIFVANHSSYMDIPPIVRAIHQPVRVLGKYEMVKYPVFGLIYRAAVVVVDRSSAEKRARSVRALKSALQKGISIFIFPEGTFNETGKPLKEFYDGAFRLAVDTKKQIIPTLIFNTRKVLPAGKPFFMLPYKLEMHFLPPVNSDDCTARELKEKVFRIMWDYYEANK